MNITQTGFRIAAIAVAGILLMPVSDRPARAENPPNASIDIVHFATRLQRFEELVFKLAPGDNQQARMLLKGLDILSGEIADYRIRNKLSRDPTLENISNRIIKLRQDILRIESASPEEVADETQKQIEHLKTVSWNIGNEEDKVSRLVSAAALLEKRTRMLAGKNLAGVADEIGKHLSLISEGLEKVSEGNAIMGQIQEQMLANPGLYQFDAKLVDKINTDRRGLDDMQALLGQRRHEYATVRDAIGELSNIDNEILAYPSAYAQAISDFRAHLILSSPEAFSTEMRHAHSKLIEAERLIQEGRRSEATSLMIEAQETYEKWAPTYQKSEELYLKAKDEHDRVDALGARRTALYAFLFQSLAGTLKDLSALEQSEQRGIQKYLRAVEPLHDDFAFFVDRYQTVAETWAYVGGAGLKQRLQALMLDMPISSGKTRVVKK